MFFIRRGKKGIVIFELRNFYFVRVWESDG